MVECKRPSLDTAAGWKNTLNGQVLDDLRECGNPSDRIFSAVAIGKKVRFYRFDGNAQQRMLPLHPGTIDMDAPTGLAQIDTMMNHVKQQGFQWAMS